MQDYIRQLNEHYATSGLAERILDAFERAGVPAHRLTRDDLARLDEFHIRGREATRDLAALAGVAPDEHVLDVGCGTGGPARTLAAEFGCRVTGIDVVAEYIRTARRLTELVGPADRVSFTEADALALPFDEAAFDVAWLQHVSMNVADKPRLFAEARRVLRPGGRLALYEIVAGEAGAPYYPVPWAPDASLSFLDVPDALRRTTEAAGFRVRSWEDFSDAALAWFRQQLEALPDAPDTSPAPVGIHLLMDAHPAEKIRNVVRNLAERRIRVVRGVLSAT